MRLELAREMPGAVLVHVDAGELRVASGKPVPYPFTVGVIKRQKNRSLRFMVWTPAASKPRGYPAAARAFLEGVIRKIELGVLPWPSAAAAWPVREGVGASAAQPRMRGRALDLAAHESGENPEGLTFPEWLAAAGIVPPTNHATARKLAAAWAAGEDPSEHRAAAQSSRAKPGYTSCACRDCMEVAIGVPGAALCSDCEQAGCSLGDRECQSPHAYGGG